MLDLVEYDDGDYDKHLPTTDIPVLGAIISNGGGLATSVTPRPAYGWHDLYGLMVQTFGPIASKAGCDLVISSSSMLAAHGDYYRHVAGHIKAQNKREITAEIIVMPYEDAVAAVATSNAYASISINAWRALRWINQCGIFTVRSERLQGQCRTVRRLIRACSNAYRSGNQARIDKAEAAYKEHELNKPCINI